MAALRLRRRRPIGGKSIMASFAVTTAGQKVSLDGQGGAQAQYTVTNTSSVPLKGRLLPVALDSASREWCSVAGDALREFGPNGVERALVEIRIPGGTPPGTYSFRLDAVSEADPDEDFTEGPSVSLDVAAPPAPKKKFPWWIFIVIGAVVVLMIIGVVVWLLTKGDGESSGTTCLKGYVWREAVTNDHVCVTPAVRTQTQQDNGLADSRRNPNGGPYGPDTCLVGYVWREAVANDHVCVTGATREQARSDNAAADSRRKAIGTTIDKYSTGTRYLIRADRINTGTARG